MNKIFNKLSFFKEWADFIRESGLNIVFIALFYSLKFCYSYVENYDFSLHRFPGRMIGAATFSGIDVAKRVGLFYNVIFLFIIINAGFYLAAFLVARKKTNNVKVASKKQSPVKVAAKKQTLLKELNILNISSLIGCILLFFKVFKLNATDGINLVIITHVAAIVFLVVKKYFLGSPLQKVFDGALFSAVICISFCFLFLFKEYTTLFHLQLKISLSIFVSFFSSLLFISIAAYIRNLDYNKALNFLIKLFWVLIPLMLLPLFTMLKDEIYLILNSKKIYFLTPSKLYFILLVLAAGWIYWRSRKEPKQLQRLSIFRLLSNYYFPLLILGITTYVYYNPFIVNNPATIGTTFMFEGADRFLPVMEFLKFHVIPLLERFNAHMLSEIITIYIYAILNSLKGVEPLIYDFFFPVSSALIAYFIIKDFTKNSYVALFVVLLFPLATNLIPADVSPYNNSLALLVVYVLYRIIYRVPSVKNYVFLLCSFIFLLLWKLDTGVAGVVSISMILLIYYFAEKIKINYKFLLKAFIYVATPVLLVFLLFLANGINVIGNLLNEYNFISSAQSYGYPGISNKAPDRVFQMQYFIFPFIAFLLSGYILFNFKKLTTSSRSKFATLCMLFCIGFYLANFQRGLVRHSFVENEDAHLSSFIFFILPSSVYLLGRYQSHLIKFLLFIGTAFLLITGYKYPDCNPFVVYESFKTKSAKFTQIRPQADINREIDSASMEKNEAGLQNFVANELKSDETFMDFSNEPMVYYYTQKIVPSYFDQSPISMHNDYLQKRYLEKIKEYKIPMLIFSHLPSNTNFDRWFDNMDGIPNSLRHYHIAEYIFQEYEPFATVRNHCLWRKKNSSLKNEITHLLTFRKDLQPSLPDDAFQGRAIDSIATTKEGNVFVIISRIRPSDEDCGLSYLPLNATMLSKMTLLYSDPYTGRLFYALQHGAEEKIKFYLTHLNNIASIEMYETKYVPDFYSTLPQHWNIGMLPYIWANYDDKILSAPLQSEIANSDVVISNSAVAFNLPPNIDKSTGNYIYISLEATNEKAIAIQLAYAQSTGVIDFTLPPGQGVRTFVIRISSQYNWYFSPSANFSLYAPPGDAVHVKEIRLLKGD